MAARVLAGMSLIVCAGCRSPDGAPAPQVGPEADQAASSSAPPAYRDEKTRRRTSSAARADQALRERTALDYQRPFRGEKDDDGPLRALYAEACRDGDKRSCWVRAALGHWAHDGIAQVAANCRLGDLLSCRALPKPEEVEFEATDLPGAAGRASSCKDPACDVEALRQECSMGFPYSCDEMQYKVGNNPALRDAYYARALMLAREGCRMDMTTECRLLRGSRDNDDRLLAGEHRCALNLYDCLYGTEMYESIGDLTRARDLQERACQHTTSRGICFYLGKEYMRGLFEEPVAGRGEALVSWACDDDSMQRKQPDCMAGAGTQATPSASSQ